jgi:twitching motility protein PilJ
MNNDLNRNYSSITTANNQENIITSKINLMTNSLDKSNITLATEEQELDKDRYEWNSIQDLWKKLNLKTKTTLFAILIGTLPTIAIGGIDYILANNALQNHILKEQQNQAVRTTENIAEIIDQRYDNIKELSILINNLNFTNLEPSEKVKFLDNFLEQGIDSIALINPSSGNTILSVGDKTLSNYKNINFYQDVLKRKKTLIVPYTNVEGTEKFVTIAPIFEKNTNNIIYIIRTTTPINYLQEKIATVFQGFKNDKKNQEKTQYYIAGNNGLIFLSNKLENRELSINSIFPNISKIINENTTNTTTDLNVNDQKRYLIAHTPLPEIEGLEDQKWSTIVATDAAVAFATQRQLLLTIIMGTMFAALTTGSFAVLLANKATHPILNATEAVEKLGKGELNTRLLVTGEDELAILANNINLMAEQIQFLLSAREESAFQQTVIAQEQREKTDQLQKELIQLLSDVEGVSRGDLTVRAEITEGEIGIVADFFNSIIESLREIVIQVKQAANQVNLSVGDNENSIQELAGAAIRQADRINEILYSVEMMTGSIEQVADSAKSAATVAKVASHNAKVGGLTMEKTVESILQLRYTVAETAKKVKRLGESSQQISKVISLINQIAMQTNLLAINASIEAARAGEEGRGFAVVAEEVGELAAQSAAATKEIEQIVENIQLETNSVVEAMEVGTTQVVEGTRLVEQTKESLAQIVEVSTQIDLLVQSISNATVSQAMTSQSVKELMQEIAQISQNTSDSSKTVARSLKETVSITEELQESVSTFQV